MIYSSFDKITLIISFDLGGIITVRFEFFSFYQNPVLTGEIIELLCDFIDRKIFLYLKDQFEKIYVPSQNQAYLKIHETYPMLSSINVPLSDKSTEKSEIAGIVWKDELYEEMDKEIIAEITKNDIGIYKKDIFTIATPASLLICDGEELSLDSEYLEDRINSVEIFCRQQHLLKKLDFKLDNLISRSSSNRNGNLKSILEEIRYTKIEINSLLEFYRNTKIHAIDSFKLLFNILNKVFGLNKEYGSVQEKLKVCEDLYIGEYESRRSKLTEKIQKTIVYLGSLSLIVATLNLVKVFLVQIILIEVIVAMFLIIQIRKPESLRDYFFTD